jgi:uncharacterized protein
VNIEALKQMLAHLLQALVEYPQEIVITPIEGEKSVVFEVQVNTEDTGKVIGKKGRTINALRTLLRSTPLNAGKKVMMELV